MFYFGILADITPLVALAAFAASLIVITSSIGMIGLGTGMIGYWLKPMRILLRAITVTGGILLVVPELTSSIIGGIILLSVVIYQARFAGIHEGIT